MNRLQAVILGVLAIVMGALILGPYLDLRRADSAIVQLEIISEAVKRYSRHTGLPCSDLRALLEDPVAEDWRGPYIDSAEMLRTPWGGAFVIDTQRGVVGLAREGKAPEKYRLGGIAELSMGVRDDPVWWSRDVLAN